MCKENICLHTIIVHKKFFYNEQMKKCVDKLFSLAHAKIFKKNFCVCATSFSY